MGTHSSTRVFAGELHDPYDEFLVTRQKRPEESNGGSVIIFCRMRLLSTVCTFDFILLLCLVCLMIDFI